MIYHLTTSPEWQAAQRAGEYRPPSLEDEGFIHCSTDEQLQPVAERFFQGVPDVLVLWIDPERLSAQLLWEAPTAGDAFAGQRFPHIYGPLNLDAVVQVSGLP